MKPGKFFILKFDFSGIECSSDLQIANRALKEGLTSSFLHFYDEYAVYVGGDKKKLYKRINHENPAESLSACVRVVRGELLNARENGNKALADVEGVNNELLLT
jgi:hypothetical protein